MEDENVALQAASLDEAHREKWLAAAAKEPETGWNLFSQLTSAISQPKLAARLSGQQVAALLRFVADLLRALGAGVAEDSVESAHPTLQKLAAQWFGLVLRCMSNRLLAARQAVMELAPLLLAADAGLLETLLSSYFAFAWEVSEEDLRSVQVMREVIARASPAIRGPLLALLRKSVAASDTHARRTAQLVGEAARRCPAFAAAAAQSELWTAMLAAGVQEGQDASPLLESTWCLLILVYHAPDRLPESLPDLVALLRRLVFLIPAPEARPLPALQRAFNLPPGSTIRANASLPASSVHEVTELEAQQAAVAAAFARRLLHLLYALLPHNTIQALQAECAVTTHGRGRAFLSRIKPILLSLRFHHRLLDRSARDELAAARWRDASDTDVHCAVATVSLPAAGRGARSVGAGDERGSSGSALEGEEEGDEQQQEQQQQQGFDPAARDVVALEWGQEHWQGDLPLPPSGVRSPLSPRSALSSGDGVGGQHTPVGSAAEGGSDRGTPGPPSPPQQPPARLLGAPPEHARRHVATRRVGPRTSTWAAARDDSGSCGDAAGAVQPLPRERARSQPEATHSALGRAPVPNRALPPWLAPTSPRSAGAAGRRDPAATATVSPRTCSCTNATVSTPASAVAAPAAGRGAEQAERGVESPVNPSARFLRRARHHSGGASAGGGGAGGGGSSASSPSSVAGATTREVTSWRDTPPVAVAAGPGSHALQLEQLRAEEAEHRCDRLTAVACSLREELRAARVRASERSALAAELRAQYEALQDLRRTVTQERARLADQVKQSDAAIRLAQEDARTAREEQVRLRAECARLRGQVVEEEKRADAESKRVQRAAWSAFTEARDASANAPRGCSVESLQQTVHLLARRVLRWEQYHSGEVVPAVDTALRRRDAELDAARRELGRARDRATLAERQLHSAGMKPASGSGNGSGGGGVSGSGSGSSSGGGGGGGGDTGTSVAFAAARREAMSRVSRALSDAKSDAAQLRSLLSRERARWKQETEELRKQVETLRQRNEALENEALTLRGAVWEGNSAIASPSTMALEDAEAALEAAGATAQAAVVGEAAAPRPMEARAEVQRTQRELDALRGAGGGGGDLRDFTSEPLPDVTQLTEGSMGARVPGWAAHWAAFRPRSEAQTAARTGVDCATDTHEASALGRIAETPSGSWRPLEGGRSGSAETRDTLSGGDLPLGAPAGRWRSLHALVGDAGEDDIVPASALTATSATGDAIDAVAAFDEPRSAHSRSDVRSAPLAVAPEGREATTRSDSTAAGGATRNAGGGRSE